MGYTFLEWMELLSYVATVVGIPMALVTLMHDNYKERQAEQGEIYDDLMAHYAEIQNKLFDYPELDQHDKPLSNLENMRRQRILYEMLVSLFERAFIMLYGERDPAYRRMWHSWSDYIEYWGGKSNFRECLPSLMKGEDPAFVAYMAKMTGMKLEP